MGPGPMMCTSGYTPGYLGTEVGPDNVVVYGTGWVLPAIYRSYWVGWSVHLWIRRGLRRQLDVGFGFGFSDGTLAWNLGLSMVGTV